MSIHLWDESKQCAYIVEIVLNCVNSEILFIIFHPFIIAILFFYLHNYLCIICVILAFQIENIHLTWDFVDISPTIYLSQFCINVPLFLTFYAPLKFMKTVEILQKIKEIKNTVIAFAYFLLEVLELSVPAAEKHP